jgi:hypothetical protein
MKHPVDKGDVTALVVAAALIKRGEVILLPFSQNSRYDLAVDRNGQLFRIQCKTGRIKVTKRNPSRTIRFKVCSGGGHERRPRKAYTSDEIDAFGVYCPETGAVYLVPFAEVAAKTEVWITEARAEKYLV